MRVHDKKWSLEHSGEESQEHEATAEVVLPNIYIKNKICLHLIC